MTSKTVTNVTVSAKRMRTGRPMPSWNEWGHGQAWCGTGEIGRHPSYRMVGSRAVRALGGQSVRLVTATTALAALVALAGCGGGARQDVSEPSGTFTVDVIKAAFPLKQRLADRSTLEIGVRNAGNGVVPNVAVTVTAAATGNAPAGSTIGAAAFAEPSDQPGLADPSRPVWVLDNGPTGGVTAYTNTWALGALKPGETKTFLWHVTAVKAGMHAIKYRVAAGLNGKAKAKLPGGADPIGDFTVNISRKPADARVADNGQVVVEPK
jgi:hypothetical protein